MLTFANYQHQAPQSIYQRIKPIKKANEPILKITGRITGNAGERPANVSGVCGLLNS